MGIYQYIIDQKNRQHKMFAVLVDPDKTTESQLKLTATLSEKSHVDFIFIGGSLLQHNSLDRSIDCLKANCKIPIVLFPGSTLQISNKADAILFLSLISGRNPEMLIGKHVIVSSYLKASNLEVISTGYMLIESGRSTSVSYMSNSVPIPSDKNDIACCTAMAGELLGMKLIYLDAGSGAQNPVPDAMIQVVRQSVDVPIVVGGGIRNSNKALQICKSGADIIVLGNAIENKPGLITEVAEAIKRL